MEQKEKKAYAYAKLQSELSVKRTIMASKRTFLSYISIAVVFVSLACTFIKLNNKIDVFSIVWFCLSGVFLVLGIVDFVLTLKEIKIYKSKIDECDE